VLTPVFSQVFEFKATSVQTSANITFSKLRRLMFFANATSTGYPIISDIRLDWIEVWGFGSTGSLIPSLISVVWGDPVVGAPSVDTSCYGNANHMARLKIHPPKRSLIGDWQNVTNDALVACFLNCAADDLVRVKVSFSLTQSSADAQIAGTGAVADVVNYNHLSAGLQSTNVSAVTTIFV
jgi:hypothetical protein